MVVSRPRTSVVVTLLVGVATLVALALPEGVGGRDSVVRLTRGGLQRLGCPDTPAYGADDAESCLDGPSASPAGPARLDGPPPTTRTVTPAIAGVPVPMGHGFVAWWPAPFPGASVPRGHAAAGRAPPAL